jgi:inorganic pyrophosphatase
MAVHKVPAGKDVPNDVNVIIEIPAQQIHIKYEIDKDSGELVVDRFMPTPMFMPCHYGYIPHTLGEDGDPIDALLVTDIPVVPRCVVRARPVAVLEMEDESGVDAKVVCVPHEKLDARFKGIADMADLDKFDSMLRERIRHFYENYKALEPGKWVKVSNWADVARAKEMIVEAIKREEDKAA